MKALVYVGQKQLEFREVPDPVLREGEVLVQIESVGICGSDMHAYLGHDERRPEPLILGHEAAGTIVTGNSKGKRVTINPLVSCSDCSYCLDGRENLCSERQIISMQPREGAFAEYVAIPETNVVEVPSHVEWDKAALAEPIACGWHATRIAREKLHGNNWASANTLVIGGGAIGIGAALSLHAQGVKNVVLAERNETRVAYLRALGEFDVVSTAQLSTDAGYDLVIDCVGMGATRQQASQSVLAGGMIVSIGLGDSLDGLDLRRFTLQEIGFVGTYTYTHDDFCQTAKAIFDGTLGSLSWTEPRTLADGGQAFTEILTGVAAAPKIILKPKL